MDLGRGQLKLPKDIITSYQVEKLIFLIINDV